MQRDDERHEKKKPGREEFKQDMAEAVEKGTKKANAKKRGQKRGKRKGKYDDLTTKELYQLVKQKRDMILEKKGIPAKLPRGRQALIDICFKIKVKR